MLAPAALEPRSQSAPQHVHFLSSCRSGVWVQAGANLLGLERCTFQGNANANGYGGGIRLDPGSSFRSIATTLFAGNTAASGGALGAADLAADSASLTGVTFSGNIASQDGGAVRLSLMQTCSFLFEGCVFSGNVAMAGSGGGLYVDDVTPPVELQSCIISNNTAPAGSGGGLALSLARNVSLLQCNLTSNGAHVQGGALSHDKPGALHVQHTRLASNMAGSGGGALYCGNDVDLLMQGSVLRGNSVEGGGGGGLLCALCSTANILNSTFDANVAALHGGGASLLLTERPAIVSDCIFMGNAAALGNAAVVPMDGLGSMVMGSSGSSGSGVANGGASSVLVGEGGVATGSGGALCLVLASSVQVTNSTFTSNSATNGGGIYVQHDASSRDLVMVPFLSTADDPEPFAADVRSVFNASVAAMRVQALVACNTFSFNRVVGGGGGALFTHFAEGVTLLCKCPSGINNTAVTAASSNPNPPPAKPEQSDPAFALVGLRQKDAIGCINWRGNFPVEFGYGSNVATGAYRLELWNSTQYNVRTKSDSQLDMALAVIDYFRYGQRLVIKSIVVLLATCMDKG